MEREKPVDGQVERSPGVLRSVLRLTRKFGSFIASLFCEDPALRAEFESLCTPALVDQFGREFRRMLTEAQKGAGDFLRRVRVHSASYERVVYEIVWKEVIPKKLEDFVRTHPEYFPELAERLRDACALTVIKSPL